MSARDPLGDFGQVPQVGRIMTDQERLVRMQNESAAYIDGEQLRSAFAISDVYVVTAWHCAAGNRDQRVWFRLRQHVLGGPRYLYLPMRLANFSTVVDTAVLTIDEPGLDEAQLTVHDARKLLAGARLRLSARVQLHDRVRIIGFPASASSADSDTNSAQVVDLNLPMENTTAVKLFGDAFAAVDPVNPRGLSGGPVLTYEPGIADGQASEAVVAMIRAVPRGAFPDTASGGSLIATHIVEAAAALPEIAQALARAEQPPPAGESSAFGSGLMMPRLLPPRIAHFTGRQEDLSFLDGLLAESQSGAARRTAVISAIDGTAGVGKTALAIYWAHRVRDQFPDGNLYVNLRGYDFSAPVSAHEAMDYFLRSLGTSPSDIPQDPDARTSLYRSVLYDRQILLVLDNAASVEQVGPLLPTSDSAFTLITSRSRLPRLAATHGTAQLSLDLMTESEAMSLLRDVVGAERVEREAASAERLIRQCARLPLALRIVADQVNTRPRASLATISADLGENESSIDNFSTVDESLVIGPVFDWSYRSIRTEDAEIFRRLGLHPGADISVESAAALVKVPSRTAERMLYRLAAAHLVEEISDRRYTFHDLLRLYAKKRCNTDDDERDRLEAFGNLAAWYLHTANNANKLIMPQRSAIKVQRELAGTPPLAFSDFTTALSWCETERSNLTLLTTEAYGRGMLDVACQLPVVLRGFFNLRKHWVDWQATHEIALQAATQLADTSAEAAVLNGIGTLLKQTGRGHEAIQYHQDALDRRRHLEDAVGIASSLDSLGHAYRDAERFDEALECFQESLGIRQDAADVKGQAWSLNNLGETEHEIGHEESALRFLRLSLNARIEVGDKWGQGRTLHALGETQDALGDCVEASRHYEDAVAVRREISDRWGVAQSLDAWGDTERRIGNLARARDLWSEALTILGDLGEESAAAVAAKISDLDNPAAS
jgi:tetratricopeptide (TPR) repeat protein